ncbi:hypothetical protein V1264_019853 [Littorina saxatilis]|uniref:Uncharacterized protein n=1 Tax=Littorina saxatilis TaxID=31220 RepID=A0AAN9BA11_9CAEN
MMTTPNLVMFLCVILAVTTAGSSNTSGTASSVTSVSASLSSMMTSAGDINVTSTPAGDTNVTSTPAGDTTTSGGDVRNVPGISLMLLLLACVVCCRH